MLKFVYIYQSEPPCLSSETEEVSDRETCNQTDCWSCHQQISNWSINMLV